jgi:hypothetical protein
LLLRVADRTSDAVDAVRPDQFGDPTPSTEWTVRELINHINGGAITFAVSAEQGSVSDELLAQLMGVTTWAATTRAPGGRHARGRGLCSLNPEPSTRP